MLENGNEGANSQLKSHSGNEGARTRDKWGHSGNEVAKNKQRKHNYYIKLMIVDIDA